MKTGTALNWAFFVDYDLNVNFYTVEIHKSGV